MILQCNIYAGATIQMSHPRMGMTMCYSIGHLPAFFFTGLTKFNVGAASPRNLRRRTTSLIGRWSHPRHGPTPRHMACLRPAWQIGSSHVSWGTKERPGLPRRDTPSSAQPVMRLSYAPTPPTRYRQETAWYAPIYSTRNWIASYSSMYTLPTAFGQFVSYKALGAVYNSSENSETHKHSVGVTQ